MTGACKRTYALTRPAATLSRTAGEGFSRPRINDCTLSAGGSAGVFEECVSGAADEGPPGDGDLRAAGRRPIRRGTPTSTTAPSNTCERSGLTKCSPVSPKPDLSRARHGVPDSDAEQPQTITQRSRHSPSAVRAVRRDSKLDGWVRSGRDPNRDSNRVQAGRELLSQEW